MATSSHHVACVTDDPEAVHTFLTEVVGLPVHLEFTTSGADISASAGWPENTGAHVTMYGTPPTGIVEVIAIPDELRGLVRPHIWLVSFATSDLAGRVAAARRHGLDASEPTASTSDDVDVCVSLVEVGGICWEFANFGSTP
jgi:hypothetical protein